VEDNIQEVVTETVSHIRRQERQLVAALHAMCTDGVDDETRAERKKALSEHVRQLEDACDAADKLLNIVNEGSGPAAFLLQLRRTVDAMTSLMTSQTTSVTDWPRYKQQVRFEAYGLDSAHGLRVGRLVIDDQHSDIEDGRLDDLTSAQQHIHTYPAVTVPRIDDDSEWIEVKLSDMSVQTDELDQSSPSSRCQASGSVSASTLRLCTSHDQHAMTGVSRRRPSSPTAPAAAASSSSSSSSSLSSTTGTLNDHVTSTLTTVNVVSSSTNTERLETCDQSTHSHLSSVICHDQQTNTESLLDVHHRATSTDQLQMCSLGVTAAPLTTDKSTSIVQSTDVSLVADDDSVDADTDLTTTISFSTCSAPIVSSDTALQSQPTPHSSISTTRIDDNFVYVESSVTSASTLYIPPLSSAAVGSVDLTAGLARVTSSLKTGDCDASTAVAPSVRLASLLPDIARTADILAASHFSSGLTAGLLREIVDVGLQITSSCRRDTQDATTNTTDQQANNGVKFTPIMDVRSDLVEQGVGESVVTTTDVSTLTKLTPTTFDKETSTVRAHQVNKNVATDSLTTADKQTSMSIDIASAYIASTVATTRRVVSVSRGTSTPSQSLVDRATSPVSVTLVDKAVTASKAEALEPIDTFQAAGQLSDPLSPRNRRFLSLSPRSKLACISESTECYDEEETEDLDDVSATAYTSERLDMSQRRSLQRGLTSTKRSSTSMMQQPQVGQLSANVFNFDHVVTSRFAQLTAACLPSTLLDDARMSSSAVSNSAGLPSSADQSCLSAHVQGSTHDVHAHPPVDS